ncbi:dTDP-4-dehydrorhamnose 3,5-epimerase family protein [Halosquirtibacter laminarini]|uniref:dTDP-4-dehydrorhamnose 3,5-epimerase family protein n=1 Tax=Halosquirtibacter laminarini TaxID=3374600 RepID=A0AC61NHY3_9BACT|nr:dTDP-4-dehydrorhamnose 3,5-epimerase family protein [Prolixibacteraceae bacterium]
MKLNKTSIDGLLLIENFQAEDNRGAFVKTFNRDDFSNNSLNVEWKESYFSISHKGTIRGMHFQNPPHDHEKLVYVAKGAIIDVVLDLRSDSNTFSQYEIFELNDRNRYSLYIPKGLAHGFMSLEDGTITVYNVSTVYAPESDNGILYNSFGYDWNGITKPIISERDLKFQPFTKFKSPFL